MGTDNCMVCNNPVHQPVMFNDKITGLCLDCLDLLDKANNDIPVMIELHEVKPPTIFSWNSLYLVVHGIFGDGSKLYRVRKTKNFPVSTHFMTRVQAEKYEAFNNISIIFVRCE